MSSGLVTRNGGAGVIRFRNSYETTCHEIGVGEVLSVAETKVMIARELGLEKDFARTFDLKLVDANGHLDFSKDNALVLPGASLVVYRTLWKPVTDVVHDATKNVTEWVHGDVLANQQQQQQQEPPRKPPPAQEGKLTLLEGLLCSYCGGLVDQPMLARCKNQCNKSVCKFCADVLLTNSPVICPKCQSPTVKNFVINRTLSLMVKRLDLSKYNLPPSVPGVPLKPIATSNTVKPSAPAVQVSLTRPNDKTSTPHELEDLEANRLGWMLVVHSSQISECTRTSKIFLPALAQCGLTRSLLDGSYQSEPLCVISPAGGGTSIVSPGIATVTSVEFIPGTDPLDDQLARFLAILTPTHLSVTQETNPPEGSSQLHDAVPYWLQAHDNSQVISERLSRWYGRIDELPKFPLVACNLAWAASFSPVVMLPGKAQPIAGLLAGASSSCLRNTSSTHPPHKMRVIRLLGPQRQTVVKRLLAEAHFAKSTPTNNAPQSHTSLKYPHSKTTLKAPELTHVESPRRADAIRAFLKTQTLKANWQWHFEQADFLAPCAGLLPRLTSEQFAIIRALQSIALGKPVDPPPCQLKPQSKIVDVIPKAVPQAVMARPPPPTNPVMNSLTSIAGDAAISGHVPSGGKRSLDSPPPKGHTSGLSVSPRQSVPRSTKNGGRCESATKDESNWRNGEGGKSSSRRKVASEAPWPQEEVTEGKNLVRENSRRRKHEGGKPERLIRESSLQKPCSQQKRSYLSQRVTNGEREGSRRNVERCSEEVRSGGAWTDDNRGIEGRSGASLRAESRNIEIRDSRFCNENAKVVSGSSRKWNEMKSNSCGGAVSGGEKDNSRGDISRRESNRGESSRLGRQERSKHLSSSMGDEDGRRSSKRRRRSQSEDREEYDGNSIKKSGGKGSSRPSGSAMGVDRKTMKLDKTRSLREATTQSRRAPVRESSTRRVERGTDQGGSKTTSCQTKPSNESIRSVITLEENTPVKKSTRIEAQQHSPGDSSRRRVHSDRFGAARLLSTSLPSPNGVIGAKRKPRNCLFS